MNFTKLSQSRAFQFALLLFVAFFWGSTFMLMKKGLRTFSFAQVTELRLILSALWLLPFTIIHRAKINRKLLRPILIMNFLGVAAPTITFAYAQTAIDSSITAILTSLSPVMTLIVGIVLYRTKTKFLKVLGLLVGLIGAFGLIYHDSVQNTGVNPMYRLHSF